MAAKKSGLSAIAKDAKHMQATLLRYQATIIDAQAIDPDLVSAIACIGTIASTFAKYLPKRKP